MKHSNGAEGFVSDGEYLMLWPLETLVEENQGDNAAECVPGLFLFGSNGGGEAFAFDTRRPGLPIVQVPFIVLCLEDALDCGSSFIEFLEHLSEMR
jgi:hypothetical protein